MTGHSSVVPLSASPICPERRRGRTGEADHSVVEGTDKDSGATLGTDVRGHVGVHTRPAAYPVPKDHHTEEVSEYGPEEVERSRCPDGPGPHYLVVHRLQGDK